MVLSIPVVDAAFGFPGGLPKPLPAPHAKVHAQVYMRIDQFDSLSTYVNLFSVQLDPAPPGYQAFAWFLQAAFGQLVLQEYRVGNDGGVEQVRYPVPASFATFVRMELNVDMTQSPLLIELYLDGTLAIHVNTPSLALGPATGYDFIVGSPAIDAVETPWLIHYDNALMDLSN